ncbi:TRAP transporter permease [Hwanghaeella grinnelliae]|uniref:TRAP transporter permease n=1 Tax=Hwanghaeella grinnelliae TaxID=2500179 RepID=UPI001386A0DD|nr:TRAP transporter fused permease subunit [Hwanghaeella grinnelliae]
MSLVSIAFDTGLRRKLTGKLGTGVKVFAAATAAWTVYAAGFSRTDVLSLTITFLSLMLVLTFLLITPTVKSNPAKLPWFEWIGAGLALAAGGYFLTQTENIAVRITLLTPLSTYDVAAATAIILLSIEAMRRTVGLGLTAIVLLFIAYNLFGDLLGGPMGHGEISYTHFLDIMVFTTDGLFGVPLRVAATYAFLFVMFGTVLAKTGGSDFFFDIAASLTGGTKGGPAKIAVISSGMYGTISGSPTSDVVTTGSVTIPMMKRLGYSSTFAGAVEVAASTGGSLVPPVMGAAAFIMAEYTNIDYLDIALAAILPAMLYYIPIYLQVHLRASKIGLEGLDPSLIPPVLATLKRGGMFLVPLVVITWALVNGYTPTYAAIYGTMAVVVVSMLRKDTRLTPSRVFDILADTCVKTVAVTGACAAAGLVIGGITMTGLASKFGVLVFLISGDSVLVSLMVAAGLTLLLGLGMPTPSAYILAAVLIAPVMQDLGVDLMAGHLFLLYFAVMSALTPPVAVAAYAASALADAPPLKIAALAVRIAIGAFLVPFAFVHDPALILQGTPFEIASAFILVATGLSMVVAAQEGYLKGPLTVPIRLMLFIAGLCTIFLRPYLFGGLS